ncbi:MAG: YcgN family cysteine cluster protein [Pseudomonadota bacterium]|nr:YcgN family cysteine cluster protein [Pseudomonadota bacterium]
MSNEFYFWQNKTLSEMSSSEWDSLCDGCAKCCLHKIEDEDNGDIFYTNVACGQLNLNSCRCNNYAARTILVSDCIELKEHKISNLKWLPASCAYRLLDEGKDLPWWHPLVSGDSDTVHVAGISVKGRCVAEADISDFDDHIVTWPNEE